MKKRKSIYNKLFKTTEEVLKFMSSEEFQKVIDNIEDYTITISEHNSIGFIFLEVMGKEKD